MAFQFSYPFGPRLIQTSLSLWDLDPSILTPFPYPAPCFEPRTSSPHRPGQSPSLGSTHHLHVPPVCDGPLAVRLWHPNQGLQGGHVVIMDRRLNPHLAQRTRTSEPEYQPCQLPPHLRALQSSLVESPGPTICGHWALMTHTWSVLIAFQCGFPAVPHGKPSHTRQALLHHHL